MSNCIIQDCTKPYNSRGYCKGHYESKRRKGELETKNYEYLGLRKHPLYKVWDAMRQRCNNPKNKQYANYGGRGIKVCDEWNNSFSTFLKDMGERPDGATLDRIDNDGNYEPGNVRWADYKTQVLNRRKNKNNTSGVVGVYDYNKGWTAEIWVDYKKHYLGTFDTKDEAILARQKAEIKFGVSR